MQFSILQKNAENLQMDCINVLAIQMYWNVKKLKKVNNMRIIIDLSHSSI